MKNFLRRTAQSVSSRLGHNSKLINLLRPTYDNLLNLTSGGRGIVQTINGREQFRIDPYYRSHVPEIYEPTVCDYLRSQVKAGDVCLNIGAHVGIYALCLAQWSAPAGRVFAFEPNPLTRRVLEKHIRLNQLNDRIEIIAQAVSHEPGEASFFATKLEGYSRLGQPNPFLTHENLEQVTVLVTSIDAFCAEHQLRPNWITMDIEGYEPLALAGARKVIAAQKSLRFIIEIHPNIWETAGTSRQEFKNLLAELSLDIIPLTGQQDPLAEYGIVCCEPK